MLVGNQIKEYSNYSVSTAVRIVKCYSFTLSTTKPSKERPVLFLLTTNDSAKRNQSDDLQWR